MTGIAAHSKTESWLTLTGQTAHLGADYSPIAVSKWKQELAQLKEQYDAMTQDQRPLQEELRRLQDIRYWTTVQNTPRKTTHRTQETEL